MVGLLIYLLLIWGMKERTGKGWGCKPISFNNNQTLVSLNRKTCERKGRSPNEPHPICLPRLNINRAQTRITHRPVRSSSSLSINQYHTRLTTPNQWVVRQSCFDSGIILCEDILEENDSLFVVVIGRYEMINNQGSCGGNGLKPHMRMIEIRSCHANPGFDLVIEEVGWWDGPLGCGGCTVAEGRDGH